jgi:Glycine-rich domain
VRPPLARALGGFLVLAATSPGIRRPTGQPGTAKCRALALAAGMLGSPVLAANRTTAAGNAYNGVADFESPGSYPFTVPEGVTSVLVQLYGAGGGGGGGTSTHDGSGGGGGAYVMSVVTVTAGDTYTITVGAGGVPGKPNEPGSNGGDTQFLDPNGNVIVAAGGGQGGGSPTPGGAGGQPIGSPMVGRPGAPAIASGAGQGYILSVMPDREAYPLLLGDGGIGGTHSFGRGMSGLGGIKGYAFIAY